MWIYAPSLGPDAGSLNVISLCTGGGGLDLALELAVPDARSVCLVEREGHAVDSLASAMEAGSMGPAPIWTDARTFAGRPWRGLVDGVIGGIPCQPHSKAGKRLGADDERDLWSAARRIWVQSGAWFFLLENVEGMLSSGGAERVRRDFQRLGCSLEGGLFYATEVGDSQERARFFLLACADRERPSFRLCAQRNPDQEQQAAAGVCGLHLVRADGGLRNGRAGDPRRGEVGRAAPGGAGNFPLFPPGPDDLDAWREILRDRPELEPAVRRVADGMADRTEHLRQLGNGVVPLQGAYAIRTLATRLAARGSPGAARLVRMMGLPDA